MFVLHFHSGNSNIPAISKSGSDVCYVSSNSVFLFLIFVVVFVLSCKCWKPGMIYWVKGTLVNRLSVMWEGKYSIVLWLSLGLWWAFAAVPELWTLQVSLSFFLAFSTSNWLDGTGVWYSLPLRSVRFSQNLHSLGPSKIVSLEGRTCTKYSIAFSLPLAWSRKGFFSYLHCENLVELQEVKLTIVWGFPLEFLTQFHHTEHQAIYWLQFRFSCPVLDPTEDCTHRYLLQLAVIFCLYNSGVQQFSLWPNFSDGSKTGCWYLNLFSFLLVFMMEWQEMGSLLLLLPYPCIYIYGVFFVSSIYLLLLFLLSLIISAFYF